VAGGHLVGKLLGSPGQSWIQFEILRFTQSSQSTAKAAKKHRIPLADLLFGRARPDLLLLGAFTIALGLAGSYTGARLRPTASRMP
jgi:hypothetical protein